MIDEDIDELSTFLSKENKEKIITIVNDFNEDRKRISVVFKDSTIIHNPPWIKDNGDGTCTITHKEKWINFKAI